MENLFIGVQKCLANETCDILYLSDRFLNLLGYSREELSTMLDNSFYRLICPEDLARVKAAFYPSPAPNTEIIADYRVLKKDGNTSWIHDTCTMVQENGVDTYYCELFNASCYYTLDGYYKSILDSMTNPVIITDKALNLTFLNKAARKAYPLGENYHGKPCSSFQTPFCHTENCCFQRYQRGDSGAILRDVDGHSFRVIFSPLISASGEETGYVSVSTDITELLETQQQLKISEERYKAVLEQTDNSIWEYDFFSKKLNLLNANGRTALETGGPGSVFAGAPWSLFEQGLIHPDSKKALFQAFEASRSGQKLPSCEIQAKSKENTYRWLKLSANTIYDAEGTPLRAIGVTRDITHQKDLEELYNQEHKYRASLTSDAIGTYEVNLSKNILLHVDTNSLCPLHGLPDEKYSTLVETAAEKLVFPLHREKMKAIFNLSSLLETFERGKREVLCEYQRLNDTNEYVWVRCSAYLIKTDDGEVHAFLYIKNIDEEKAREEELRKKAEIDPLTGLYNRAACVLRMEQGLLQTAKNGNLGALLMLDIDDFKQINDTYGHVYGDAVLSELACKLMGLFRKEDIVGRLGGDEFIIYLQNIPDESLPVKKAQQVCDTMRTVYSSLGREGILSCSIGIAFSPKHGTHFNTLYQRADSALYHAKHSGKNQVDVYRETLAQQLPDDDTQDESLLHHNYSDNITD